MKGLLFGAHLKPRWRSIGPRYLLNYLMRHPTRFCDKSGPYLMQGCGCKEQADGIAPGSCGRECKNWHFQALQA